ncbi:hypothetical protein L917_06646 [Phytophthora nicotianae]|uniref:DNA replication checkpoint mediator MRC1 domain-containing protein n=2 Tax=Phytophthora nicotianae TaxID=4792 RepID=V9FEB4_PHYNI|nr:hypothetical protein F443_06957 [Phytophthora nicotianae P1569]ETL95567.1 hypothetical protein L917_06646 [Phytophthora nicotianae]ETM48770.1 hypothetical protein L914_06739 [Phytophthora nicotianae]
MSGEELALETQLLLQEATQITQQASVESVLESAGAPPPETEYEAAKSALLAKLRKKKEANRAHHQQLNQRRLGMQTPQSVVKKIDMFSPRKALKLPVAATATATSRKKQDMLFKLRTQAIQQGAQNMAELFGYASYEDHFKALNEEEEKKILANEKLKEKEEKKEKTQEEEEVDEEETEPMDTSVEPTENPQEDKETSPTPVVAENPTPMETESVEHEEQEEQESVKVVRRRNRIQKPAAEEDGNEADSEQDDKEGDDADEDMEDATEAVEATNDAENSEKANSTASSTPKDKAAAYRNLLRAEALQTRKRKRLIKGRDNFVESEAEEDEEEDVLKIGGLGDFGFGVPQAKTQESKEAEEERNALTLREGDLDHIVDDLSDDERAEQQDLEEMFRREQEDQDRQQVKEVMRNVKEGFGRNRRAFSGLHSGSGARGRFNLDELVAADGSKFEAARLGLLESDEELSEDENGEKKKKEEEDEEAEMERMLRERFLNQPKIYVTSSESGSDDEEEDEAKKDHGPDGDEVESDEERERQQMKLFSERARINRRMQRMKDLQRQITLENNEADPNAKTAMPNLLLEEDEDSQELMHMMNRTDVDETTTGNTQKKTRNDRSRPKLGRFNSYGGITSASRGSSSFSRVIGHCKLFSANSTGGGAASSKGFVFTSFSSDKAEDDDENAAPNNDEAVPMTRPELGKSKSWSGAKAAKRRGAPGASGKTNNKKRKSGGLFSVLSSFQCVSSTSQES